jgi:hypothetical protein
MWTMWNAGSGDWMIRGIGRAWKIGDFEQKDAKVAKGAEMEVRRGDGSI